MFARVSAVCGLGLLIAIMISSPAVAEGPQRIGHLVIDPARGDLLTSMDVATSDVCTRGTMFAVTLDGPNLTGADRGNVVGTTKIRTLAAESYPGHYVLPLPTDLATYVALVAPGQRIKGDYTLTFACRDTLSTDDLQVFTAKLRVDGKGRYAALRKAATPIGKFINGYSPGTAGFSYSDPTSPDPETVVEVARAEQVSSEPSSGTIPWNSVLLVCGALLILGAAYLGWHGRRETRASGALIDAKSDSRSGAGP